MDHPNFPSPPARNVLPLAVALAAIVSTASAHVHWTRSNSVDPATIALYHMDNVTTVSIPAAAPLSSDRGLQKSSLSDQLTTTSDTAWPFFQPASLQTSGQQVLLSGYAHPGCTGDLTIECWFKWTSDLTSSSLEIGFQSAARLRLVRDEANHANDRLELAGIHGTRAPHPEFPGWDEIGPEEASLDTWRHLGITIHSTGATFDASRGAYVYDPGSVARIYLNGHRLGVNTTTISLTGLQVQQVSNLTMTASGNGLVVDEVTIWSKDWSENGNVTSPFSNGRGDVSGVEDALSY